MKTLSPSLRRLIHILNDGEFHSGTALGDRLKITRSAVWKLIQQLEQYHIPIESLHGKGYRFTQALFLLDSKIILQHANLKPLQPQLKLFASLNSTQTYLKAETTTRQHPLLCLAEHQTAGRGRLGRSWYSPFGINLFFSCLWNIQKDLSELGGLSLIVSLAIIRALQEYGFEHKLYVKWPNDIYCDAKKLGGVLIEVSAETHGSAQVVIGIGLNVNMQEAPAKVIDQPWTSLQSLSNTPHERSEIAGRIIHWIFDYLQEFERHGFKQFLPLWRRHDYLKGQKIRLHNSQGITTGLVLGINDHGQLRLQMPDAVGSFATGDTSLIKPVQ